MEVGTPQMGRDERGGIYILKKIRHVHIYILKK